MDMYILLLHEVNRNQPHFTIQPRRHGRPMRIVCRAITQIDNVDFLEFAPLHSLSVQFGNSVGREIGDFYFDVVCSGFQELSYL